MHDNSPAIDEPISPTKVASRRLPLAVGMLALLTLLSLARLLDNAFGPAGGLDLHSYWYFGHFVRQGLNPYQVYAEGAPLRFPIHYLDGVTLAGPPFAQTGLAITPANTAPMVLLLTPLAAFSWPVARTIWLFINLAGAAALPGITLRLLPPQRRPQGVAALLVAVAFYAFQSTRVAAWIGQTTIFVFLLMVLAVHYRRLPWLAGLLLGVALAKYSLALPVALLFLFERRWVALGIAALVQLGGLAAVTALGSYSVLETLGVYGDLLTQHAGQPGIHLASLLPPGTATAAGAGLLLTVVVGFLLWRKRRPLLPFTLLTIATLWALLVAYHRAYDALVALLFVALAVAVWQRPGAWGAGGREATLAGWSAAGAISLLILPGEVVGRFLPATWVDWWLALANALVTVGLLGMLLLVVLWRPTTSQTPSAVPQPLSNSKDYS